MGGLWGSGNTFVERDLLWKGEETVYSSWDGRGILGPRDGLVLEKYPSLWARLDLGTFLERYGDLGPEACQVWEGAEILGVGCDEACDAVNDRCGSAAGEDCAEVCEALPRGQVDCLRESDTCLVADCSAEAAEML